MPTEAFPSLPPAGRTGYMHIPTEIHHPDIQSFQPLPPGPTPAVPPPVPPHAQAVVDYGIGSMLGNFASTPDIHAQMTGAALQGDFPPRGKYTCLILGILFLVSAWISPTQSPNPGPPVVWQPPSSELGGNIAPEVAPREYHEQLRTFAGLSVEAYRSSFGMPEDRAVVWELQCMRERVLATTWRVDPHYRLPEVVQHKYHSLLMLDQAGAGPVSAILGYKTVAYKALSTTDPFVYCLRRVDGFRLSNFDLVQDAIERWSDIKHPNIVSVRQAFATSEFQDAEGVGEGGSLVYVYDYIDLAQTMEAWHQQHYSASLVHETVLWDFALQICMALRLIHSRGLAARCVCASKILVSSRLRIHLNCVGLLDAILHQSITLQHRQPVRELQRADLVALGQILVWLGTGVPVTSVPVASDLKALPNSIQRLVEECATGSAASILGLSGSFLAFKAEQLLSSQDLLMTELRKTVDVARLNRVLIKICAIADRVHLNDDWRWASTGDRYIVQLFRDYIFFQADESGSRPFLDSGHVTDCLAKADVGSYEPVMLMNRDGSSVLVTNYNDIRRCIESSFKEIADAHPLR